MVLANMQILVNSLDNDLRKKSGTIWKAKERVKAKLDEAWKFLDVDPNGSQFLKTWQSVFLDIEAAIKNMISKRTWDMSDYVAYSIACHYCIEDTPYYVAEKIVEEKLWQSLCKSCTTLVSHFMNNAPEESEEVGGKLGEEFHKLILERNLA